MMKHRLLVLAFVYCLSGWNHFFMEQLFASSAKFIGTSVQKAQSQTSQPQWLPENSSRSVLDNGSSSLLGIRDHAPGKLVGFYHVAIMNEWQSVLASQLGHLNSSGLLGQSSAVHITLLGNETSQVHMAMHQFNESGKLQSYQAQDLRSWEFPTLERLHDHCKKNTRDFVYYFHSKGVSKQPGSRDFRREQEWRQVMEHFIFDNWHDCVSLMQQNVHKWACGARYYDPCPHFSGNFWWAACHYVARHHSPTHRPVGHLPPEGCKRLQNGRLYAEFWLLDSPKLRSFPARKHVGNCFDDLRNHYRSDFDPKILRGVRCEEVYGVNATAH